ncbi:MAG: SIR2 family protein [Erysipelotrichaceae bacterium]
MLISGVNFPEELTNAIKDNKLVVFVGAGVSMGKPTNLPNFTELVNYIANETGYNFDEKINQYDAFLGKLEHNGIDVKRKAAECIIEKQAKPNELHKSIINLFGTKNVIRIVTTNYDQMIEKAIKKKSVLIYNAPALPLGNDFEGIVHIHGNQTDPKHMILTDSDFGDAYLLEGYASRFLSKLFSEYAVLFIGYSYGDTVMTYLSRALPDKQSKK